jgi:MFS family permease
LTRIDTSVSDSHRSAFAEPLFRRYFPSSCFSTLGSWMVRFLFGWSAWELTHSAFWVGVVAGAMLFPTFLLSPIFGIVSDRINPRNGLLFTVAMHGAVAGIAGTVYLLDRFDLPWLVVLAAALGAVTSAHTPIRLALIPRLVSRQALPSAIGYSAIIFNTSRILGPAAGAWLIVHTSLPAAYMVALILCAISLAFLLTVRDIEQVERRRPASMLRELGAGFSYVVRHRGIRLVFTFTLINGLLGRTIIELLPALSGQMLHGDSRTLATLTASAGVGSIIGGFVISRQGGSEERLLALVMSSLLLGAVSLLGVRWLQGLPSISALVLLTSMITTMVGTSSQALAQLLVAEEYRGRVLSIWAVLAMGAPAIGTLLMGAMADMLGFPAVLAIFATLAITGILIMYRRRSWLVQDEHRGSRRADHLEDSGPGR